MVEASKKVSKVQELYALALKSTGVEPPKRSFLSVKCPKCGGKLTKEMAKEMVVSGTEFGDKVLADAGLPLGAYDLRVEHYTCKCGYSFAKASTSEVDSGG